MSTVVSFPSASSPTAYFESRPDAGKHRLYIVDEAKGIYRHIADFVDHAAEEAFWRQLSNRTGGPS